MDRRENLYIPVHCIHLCVYMCVYTCTHTCTHLYIAYTCVCVCVCAVVSKMRRSNSWSESYEDFAVTDDNTEHAEVSKTTDKARHDQVT